MEKLSNTHEQLPALFDPLKVSQIMVSWIMVDKVVLLLIDFVGWYELLGGIVGLLFRMNIEIFLIPVIGVRSSFSSLHVCQLHNQLVHDSY